MTAAQCRTFYLLCSGLLLCGTPQHALAKDAQFGGFIPFVGFGLTDEFKTLDDVELGATFFISDPSDQPGAFAEANSMAWSQLGRGGSPYYDLALLDTGAATHILTQQADFGFNIVGNGFAGTQFQTIGGATGTIDLAINDALGIYAGGLGDRISAGNALVMESTKLRGQTSFATLSAPESWQLPNIIGLPMAAHHAIAINNDDPQIFEMHGRTVRTPHVEFRELGSGGQGIERRAPLKLRPGLSFVQGPLYVFNLDISNILIGGNVAFHDNPSSPSVVENAGLFIDVDLKNGDFELQEKELLFDTGADLTVISEIMAKRLGHDPKLDDPDFVLAVEGSAGVTGGIPGIFVDELNIDTVGGNFTFQNVPVAILDVTNPNDPGNVIDGIIGMHLFNGRNIVIDANPSIGQGGVGPSLYISDPITSEHSWNAATAMGEWQSPGHWTAAGIPDDLWAANVRSNVLVGDQTAVVSSDSTVFDIVVAGENGATMTLEVGSGATLTTFGPLKIEALGRVQLVEGELNAQLIDIDGGTLAGNGGVFAGTGPIRSPVRNAGRIEPGDLIGSIAIDGDLSMESAGTLAIDIAGTTPLSDHDQLTVDRFAFLGGMLEVALLNGFVPQTGNTFEILTAGEGVQGEFQELSLPAGFSWNVAYGSNSVLLEVVGLGLAGDYNGDGSVNAADYAVWRDAVGTSNMAADGNGDNVVDNWDYDVWKSNFGAFAGAAHAVPEPASLLSLATLGLWLIIGGFRRRIHPRGTSDG